MSELSDKIDGLTLKAIKLRAHYDALVTALREIAKAEGAFSLNPLKDASNTIDNMKEIAATALAEYGSL